MVVPLHHTEREANVETAREGFKFHSVGICPTCPKCQEDHGMEPREFFAKYEKGDVCDEGSFSWSDCEWCGSGYGGDRYAAHSVDENNKIVHWEVCSDCLMAEANGEPYPSETN